MRLLIVLLFIFSFQFAGAQELFVFTEPASNMAAKNIGIRTYNLLMKDLHKGKNDYSYHFMPSIMWGIKKKVMLHLTAYASNMDGLFTINGGGIYLKYRFFSREEVHSHFRMAAFASYSFSNSFIHEYAIDLNGHNTGYETGIVLTKLHKKLAISAATSFLHAMDNVNEKYLFGNQLRNAAGYSLSVGRLMLPKSYTSYKQTNINLMIELLGQTNLHNGFTWLDMAPSVQFIFNSRARLDMGYRFALATKLQRYASQGAILRLEYNFFNVL